MPWGLPKFRRLDVDRTQQEPLLHSDDEERQNVVATHARGTEQTSRGTEPCHRFPTLSFYDGYRPLNGIPVCRIRPSDSTSRFTCRAFSSDGTRFATGESNGTVRLWTTKAYILVGEVVKLFSTQVKHIRFVEERESAVTAVDNHGEMCSIDFATAQPEEGTSSATGKQSEIRCLNKGLSRGSGGGQVTASHLSNDGRSFAYRVHGDCKWIHVFRHSENGIERRLVLSFSPFEQCFPILSSKGDNLLACCVRRDVPHPTDGGDETDMQCCVLLWPNLDNIKDGTPGIELEGDKALWGLDGKYLLVWKSFDKNPKLLVCDTNEFSIQREKNEPFRCITLSNDLFAWNAQMVETCNPEEDKPRIVVYEIDNTGLRTVKVWKFGSDEAEKEVRLASSVRINPSPRDELSNRTQAERGGLNRAEGRSTWERYLELIRGTTLAEFSATRDCQWIGTYSWTQNSWELVALYSGVSVWHSEHPVTFARRPSWRWCETVFDPFYEQVVLIGDEEIIACAPSFLRPACTQCIVEDKPASSMLFHGSWEEKDLVSRVFQTVSSAALAKTLTGQLADNRRRTFALLNISLRSKTFTSVKDAAVCSNGDSLAFIAETTDHVSRVFVARRPPGRGRSFFSIQSIDLGIEASVPERVFLRDTDQSKSVILIHRKDKLSSVSFYKLWTLEELNTIALDMEMCFCASQSSDGEQVVILGPDSACIIHLDSRQKERVMYKANVARLFEVVCKTCQSQSESTRGSQILENRLSPDGHTALLGWDSKNKRGVFLTSDMATAEFEKTIEASEGWISPHCALSKNGKLTLFLDVENTCISEIHVGVFCNSARQTLYKVLAAGISPKSKLPRQWLCDRQAHLLLSNVFFGLSDDGRELVVAAMECKHRDACVLSECIKRFSVYGTEECIPDYERLTRVESDAQAIRIKRLFDDFGGSIVSAPFGHQCCLLHRAVKERNETLIDRILLHAKEKNTQVALECISEKRPFNPFEKALVKNLTNDIKTSLMLLHSPQSPFDRAARMIRVSFTRLVKQHLDIVEDALTKDRLIRKACTFEVHLHFMDWKKREESADHIDTMDSFAEWSCDSNPENVRKKWNEKHKKVLERMEKDGEKSTTKAALSFICIENAAKLGMKGILRPLLLAGVPVSFYKCETVKSVVMFKWYKIWRSCTLKNLGVYCVFLVVLMIYTVDVVSIENKSNPGKARLEFSIFPLLGLFGFGLYFLYEEYRQLSTFIKDGKRSKEGSRWTGAMYFFNSKWNCVDLLSCTLLIVCLPFCHFGSWWDGSFDVALAICLALESILAYVKVWYFTQSFRHTGSLVSLVYCVIQDCVWFLLLAAVVLVGFGSALYSLFGHLPIKDDDVDDVHEAFGSLQRTFLTLFFALFGAFDDKLCRSTKKHSWTVTVTFSCYLISETIVLFNLFIAILSDTFDKVKDSQEAHLMMRRARYIDACEAGLCSAERTKMEERIGNYVCVLLKPDESSESDKPTVWLGKINALENIFKIGIEKSQNVLKKLIEDSLKKIEDIKCVVHHQIEAGLLNGIEQLKQCFQATAGETRRRIENLQEAIPKQQTRQMAEIMERVETRIIERMDEQNSRLVERMHRLESRVEEMNENMASRVDTLLSSEQNQQPQD